MTEFSNKPLIENSADSPETNTEDILVFGVKREKNGSREVRIQSPSLETVSYLTAFKTFDENHQGQVTLGYSDTQALKNCGTPRAREILTVKRDQFISNPQNAPYIQGVEQDYLEWLLKFQPDEWKNYFRERFSSIQNSRNFPLFVENSLYDRNHNILPESFSEFVDAIEPKPTEKFFGSWLNVLNAGEINIEINQWTLLAVARDYAKVEPEKAVDMFFDKLKWLYKNEAVGFQSGDLLKTIGRSNPNVLIDQIQKLSELDEEYPPHIYGALSVGFLESVREKIKLDESVEIFSESFLTQFKKLEDLQTLRTQDVGLIQAMLPAAILSISRTHPEQLEYIIQKVDIVSSLGSLGFKPIHLHKYAHLFLETDRADLFEKHINSDRNTISVFNADLFDMHENPILTLINASEKGLRPEIINLLRQKIYSDSQAAEEIFLSVDYLESVFPDLIKRLYQSGDSDLVKNIMHSIPLSGMNPYFLDKSISAFLEVDPESCRKFFDQHKIYFEQARMFGESGTEYINKKLLVVDNVEKMKSDLPNYLANLVEGFQEKLIAGADIYEVIDGLMLPFEKNLSIEEQRNVFEFLTDNLLPSLWTKPTVENENNTQLSTQDYNISSKIEHLFERLIKNLPSELKLELLDKLFDDQYTSFRYDKLNLIDVCNTFELCKDLDSEILLDLIPQLAERQFQLSKRHTDYDPKFYLDQNTKKLIHLVAESHPLEALNLTLELEKRLDKSYQSFNEIKLVCLANIDQEGISGYNRFNIEIEELKSKNNFKNGYEYFIGIHLAYLGEGADQVLQREKELFDHLKNLNNELPEAKQTKNVDTFLLANLENIAKLHLLFPNTKHASVFISESVALHGFKRLQDRLDMMKSFNYQELIAINDSLSGLNKGEINQGLIYDLISLHDAFVDTSVNKADLWNQIITDFKNSPEQDSKQLIRNLGENLLYALSDSLGLDKSFIVEGAIEKWDLKFLPKLFEGAKRFDETNKVLFTAIIKSTMRGEFAQMIDPNGEPLDGSVYSEEEHYIINSIREHNTLTAERFKKRGLDIKAFNEGASERKIKIKVTAKDTMEQSYADFEKSMLTSIDEIKTLNLHIEDVLITDFETALSELRLATDDVLEHEVKNKRITNEELNSTVSKLLKNLMGSKDGTVAPLLDPQRVHEIREKHLLNFIKYKNGNISDIPDKKVLAQKLGSLKEELIQTSTDSDRQDLKVSTLSQIDQVLTWLANSQIEGMSSKKAKNKRPEIEDGVINLIINTKKVYEQLEQRLADPKFNHLSEQIKLQIDHMGANAKQLMSLINTFREAKDKDYELLIKRWDREPGTNIFEGNKVPSCIAIDSFNGYAFLKYLTGIDIELNIIYDISTGTPVDMGQSFEFINEADDGTLAYVIDNVELDPSLQAVSGKIRDEIFDMAKETSLKMSRTPESGGITQINMGTSYNDVPSDDLKVVERKVRKVSGHNLGTRQYLDFFVIHPEGGYDIARNPNAIQVVSMFEVPIEISGVAKQNRELVTTKVKASIETGGQEERETRWNQVGDQILRLENETFGLLSTPDDIAKAFVDESNIFVTLTDEQTGKICGYSLGINGGDYNGEPVCYVRSSALDYEYQGGGLGLKIGSELETQAKQKGFKLLSRNAMADTGYAQGIIRKAAKEGKLVEPKPVLNENKEVDIEATIKNAQINNYQSRTQMYVVTRL